MGSVVTLQPWTVAVLVGLYLLAAASLMAFPRLFLRALYGDPEPPRTPWRLLDLVVVVAVGVLGLLAVGGGLRLWDPGEPAIVYELAGMTVGLGPAVVVAARAAGDRGASATRSLGLAGVLDPRAVLAAGCAYACFVPLFLAVLGAWHAALDALGRPPQPQEVVVAIANVRGPWLAAAAFLAVVVLPAVEELLFRGFLQPLLGRYLGVAGGIAGSSVVFAVLHGVDAFVPILTLSLLLGWLRWRTGALTAPWIVHALHNGLMLALLVLVPEIRDMILDPEAAPR